MGHDLLQRHALGVEDALELEQCFQAVDTPRDLMGLAGVERCGPPGRQHHLVMLGFGTGAEEDHADLQVLVGDGQSQHARVEAAHLRKVVDPHSGVSELGDPLIRWLARSVCRCHAYPSRFTLAGILGRRGHDCANRPASPSLLDISPEVRSGDGDRRAREVVGRNHQDQ